MNTQTQKLFLEIYGLFRMIYGAALAVGLSAAYFVTEFVLRYPGDTRALILGQDEIALIYVAVFLRSIFHIGAGIGIARLKPWGRAWLIIGWPIMFLITVGVLLSVHGAWYDDGYVQHFGQTLNAGKFVLYIIFIGGDLIGIGGLLKNFSVQENTIRQFGGRMTGGRISFILATAVVAFVILLFMGRPIKDAFYGGFYKQDGRVIQRSEGKTTVLQPVPRKTQQEAAAPKSGEDVQKSSVQYQARTVGGTPVATGKKQQGTVQKVSTAKGFSYSGSIGYFAAVIVIVGFLFELLQRYQTQTSSMLAYCLLIFGFILWVIFGVLTNTAAVSLMGVGAAVVCLLILIVAFNH
ncbi:MAG: hypothetical protein KC684_05270 [Candidatus Omnitrophica bacterium]|nr:hypothetical protein [Candidatus Omnitrophota bacterium]